jgi:hypothetical protein
MISAGERFHLPTYKLEEVVHSVQAIHPEATEDDIRMILLDELEEEGYQVWLEEAPEDEITDWVRQHLETTQP